jgi:hypothetical protein
MPSAPVYYDKKASLADESVENENYFEMEMQRKIDDASASSPIPELAPSNTINAESAVASGSGSGNGSRSGGSSQAAAERKVIRTGGINMEVSSFDEAVTAIKFTVMRLGGYVTYETSYIIDGRERKAGTITARIPFNQYDEMVSQTEALGKVMDSSVWAEDVTSQYVDLQARLSVYETKRERLMALLGESGDLTSVLQVENELAATNAELESMKGQMRYMMSQTDYSTLEITLREKAAESVGIRTTGFSGFIDRVGEAFLLGVNGALRAFGNLILWFVRNLVGLVIMAAVFWLCWILMFRKWLERRKAREADKKPI